MTIDFIPKFWDIATPSQAHGEQARSKINNMVAPPQDLGVLGALAPLLSAIQAADQPEIRQPTVLVFAGDHGICGEGVVDEDQPSTKADFLQIANGQGLLNATAKATDVELRLYDMGVRDLPADEHESPRWQRIHINDVTNNFARESAMTMSHVNEAFAAADQCVSALSLAGVNTVIPVCISVGGDSAASMLAAQLSNIQVDRFIDDPSDGDAMLHYRKLTVLRKASERVHNVRGLRQDPLLLLAEFGGFEIAMAVGTILSAAQRGMTVVVDDFVTTVAFFVAKSINPKVLHYAIASQRQLGHAHQVLLQKLSATPLMSLGLSHCPGVGGIMATPVLRAACELLALTPEPRRKLHQQSSFSLDE